MAIKISGSTIIDDSRGIVNAGISTFNNIDVIGNITVSGNVDGRDVAADGALAASSVQPGDNVSTLTNDAGYLTTLPAGSILQVKQTHVNTADSQSLTAGTYTEISGLSVTITPVSSTSNMLVFIRWSGETSANAHQLNFGIRRDSTDIGFPAAAGNRTLIFAPSQISFHSNNDSTIDGSFYQFLDTGRPSGTSAITYKAIGRHVSAITLYNQRTVNNTDAGEYERSTSTIVVMEVAA